MTVVGFEGCDRFASIEQSANNLWAPTSYHAKPGVGKQGG
jgi:hypothetical protein